MSKKAVETEVIFVHFAIIEDLATDRDNLTNLIVRDCAAHGDEAEFSEYTNAEDFLADFRGGFCNAIFLDIMLGDGMDGIMAAKKVRGLDEEIPIIFTTTEHDFALESYDVHALGYLIKPVKAEKLSWCMERLRAATPPRNTWRSKVCRTRQAGLCLSNMSCWMTSLIRKPCGAAALFTLQKGTCPPHRHMRS
ncbi:MAG: response regulator [Lachnospiraceae bacterium]|nr:response regulator [Lachnospiraceae bacterium]